ncbi:MAG: DpnI domain-containing protein [Chloroflexota bacterium]
MNLYFDPALAAQYRSASQKVRVLSESWVKREAYCPACGFAISKYENNRPAADFFCPSCKEKYELKSKRGNIGSKIVDGSYDALIERLQSNTNPNLFLLNYNPLNWEILNFIVVPKFFFVPVIIEKRHSLTLNARRAGWVGCNIILQDVPQDGRIFYVENREIAPKEMVLQRWRKTLFLSKEKKLSTRGWILDIMNCIDKLNKREFTLTEMYFFESYLKDRHPRNRHIKEKIRQQLQLLRNNGYLEFINNKGGYRLT